MTSCEMPLAAASFLNAASQGSNAPVLRQLAWPNAAVGRAASISASAQPVCFVGMLMIRLLPLLEWRMFFATNRCSIRGKLPPRHQARRPPFRLRNFLLVQRQLAYPDRAAADTADC